MEYSFAGHEHRIELLKSRILRLKKVIHVILKCNCLLSKIIFMSEAESQKTNGLTCVSEITGSLSTLSFLFWIHFATNTVSFYVLGNVIKVLSMKW